MSLNGIHKNVSQRLSALTAVINLSYRVNSLSHLEEIRFLAHTLEGCTVRVLEVCKGGIAIGDILLLSLIVPALHGR